MVANGLFQNTRNSPIRYQPYQPIEPTSEASMQEIAGYAKNSRPAPIGAGREILARITRHIGPNLPG